MPVVSRMEVSRWRKALTAARIMGMLTALDELYWAEGATRHRDRS